MLKIILLLSFYGEKWILPVKPLIVFPSRLRFSAKYLVRPLDEMFLRDLPRDRKETRRPYCNTHDFSFFSFAWDNLSFPQQLYYLQYNSDL